MWERKGEISLLKEKKKKKGIGLAKKWTFQCEWKKEREIINDKLPSTPILQQIYRIGKIQ